MDNTAFEKKIEDLKNEIFQKTGQPLDEYYLAVLSGFVLETESLKDTINNKINFKEKAIYFDGPKTAARYGFGYGFGKYGLPLTTLICGLLCLSYLLVLPKSKITTTNLNDKGKYYIVSQKFVKIQKDSLIIYK